METLSGFVARLTKAIPCYSHPRKDSKGISLKKNNTMKHGDMGHFATVYDRPTKGDFKIIAKEWLANAWCKMAANKGSPKSFGNNPNNPKHAGLIFYVKKDSIGQDYQNALQALTIIRNNMKTFSTNLLDQASS